MRREKNSNIREQSKFELLEVRKIPWAQAEYRLGFGSVGMERKLPFGIKLAAFNVSIGMVEIPRPFDCAQDMLQAK